ncbi:GxGYxYP family putative glycoside hydrolase [Phytohabitans sp. ZYX-F-186]|uniref:GxGYxYP family putative glycoside hydrolase n=1 Tax=Phytohabitans maris TaxID=3071409 RepID=A0ABU0ZFG3_9ACTN|nr:GxGYxYP domain-containing protein [Phytohabitans sp. ZYX-F-186]MDQ7905801.1 GxGYxYP family putative glycoside hydrolase [Phytohabitans sp. ZYX-F-186]
MIWPEGQALPHFQHPDRLDVVDLRAAPAADTLLALTTQGIVNRSRPRIWLLRDADEGSHTWLDTLALPSAPVESVDALVARHRPEIRGAVLADPAVPATVNVATTLAGLEDAVVAEPDAAERLGLPVVADLRGRFGDGAEAYRWGVERLWPRTTRRMLVGIDHDGPGFLRDYAVACRAFVVWADPSARRERALLRRLLGAMPANSPYVGWWPGGVSGESRGTELASRHAVYVVPADFAHNLTVFGGARSPIWSIVDSHSVPPLEEERTYVTFTMTDGDNLQYCQHAMRRLWDLPERGRVPLNWTVSPLLRDAAPAILAYYQRTATPNDLLVAGPSGAGYAYPGAWPRAELAAFTRQTGEYLRDLGQPAVVNVLNRAHRIDRDLTARQVAAYARDVRPVGLLQHWTYRHRTRILAGLPVATGQLVSTVDECRRLLAKAAQRGTRFVSIGVLAWSLTPADVASVAAELDDRYRVVRADELLHHVSEAAVRSS